MQFDRKRRRFIALIGGATAFPFAARAQQGQRMRRIAVSMNYAEDDPQSQARRDSLLQGLEELGWTAGRNVQIEYRWGVGDADLNRRNAAELVALGPDVVVTSGAAVTAAMLQETRTIPIVFVNVFNPVGAGFVQSMARPAGNATGFTPFEYGMSGRWLELLKQVAPGIRRVAVLHNPIVASRSGQLNAIEALAPSLRVELTAAGARDPNEIERAVTAFARVPNGGLIVVGATDLVAQFRQAGAYVDRILKGEKPAELPVQAPSKYELVINLKSAKALGLDMPPPLLARADAVIE